MNKYLPIIVILSVVKLTIQCLGNRHYGFHRDELLHLSVSEHLDWGFMEFPPLIGGIGRLSYWLFDYSLLGVRFFPTVAGVAILVLCCLMAKELGGKRESVFLAGICILAFLPFYRNHTLFQPVAFDQLFWTLGFYLFIRFMNTKSRRFLILLGITFGLGLLTKYTILVWAFGLLIGLFFYEKGSIFRDKWLYLSGLISLMIFLPNLIWQVQNDLPIIQHLHALHEDQLSATSPLAFGLEQLNFPCTFIVSLFGLYGLLLDRKLRRYSAIGVAAIIIFSTMWILNAKAYYVFAIYPVLFASGAVKLERLLIRRPMWIYLIAFLTLASTIYYIPEATPILAIDKFVEYKNIEEQNGRVELTGDYADMFGWEEQVQLVDSIYQSLSPREQQNCVLWAENYGEAGALKILGKKYGLPNPISRHGTFWKWGYGNESADVWISLGNETPAVEYIFHEAELVKFIYHKYSIGEENGIPVYVCRNPKMSIQQWWKDYEPYIYD